MLGQSFSRSCFSELRVELAARIRIASVDCLWLHVLSVMGRLVLPLRSHSPLFFGLDLGDMVVLLVAI
jgi:hypothetical protein